MTKFSVVLGTVTAAIFAFFLFPVQAPSVTWESRLVQVNEKPLRVFIADTPTRQAQGLGGWETLPDDAGMLFEMSETARHTFWMKGMRFPIDLIFIREHRVVDLVTLSPPALGQIPVAYTPIEAADRVLELHAGGAERYGLQQGTQISFPIFSSGASRL